MKNSFYFSHDYNASQDDKILELRSVFGNEGYALYFYCLETMAQRGDGYIIASLMGGLSVGYGVPKATLVSFLSKCEELGVFYKDKKGYYSKRMIEHLNLRQKLSNAGKRGAINRWENGGAIGGANGKERKEKEEKRKKKKEISENFEKRISKFLNCRIKDLEIEDFNEDREISRQYAEKILSSCEDFEKLWEEIMPKAKGITSVKTLYQTFFLRKRGESDKVAKKKTPKK